MRKLFFPSKKPTEVFPEDEEDTESTEGIRHRTTWYRKTKIRSYDDLWNEVSRIKEKFPFSNVYY